MRLVDSSPVFGNGRAAVSLGVPEDGGQSRDETEEARVQREAGALRREAERSERAREYVAAAIQYDAAADVIEQAFSKWHWLVTGEGSPGLNAKAFRAQAEKLRNRERLRRPMGKAG